MHADARPARHACGATVIETDQLNRIKKLIIIALVSDDELLETLVLKGGNAIDLIHGAAMRGSIDLDFSMESDFSDPDVGKLLERFENLLNATFEPAGLHALDVRFRAKPPVMTADMRGFWGGYELEFKIVTSKILVGLAGDQRRLRHAAETVGPGGTKRFRVDFSRHEYCEQKEERSLDGYSVYVYTPRMIVCEKLRAICQQTDEYRRIVKSRRGAARAKDFFDIHTLVEHFKLDPTRDSNVKLLKAMFEAKRVPLTLLGQIPKQRELHRTGFDAVRETVKPGVTLREFDFYFDYVLGVVRALEPFWNV